jgi:ABC-type multidrug transport system ATPase subunit
MLKVENLSRSYNGKKIIRNLSFELAAGHLLILLGRNGSGKTTLLNCLAGIRDVDSGRVLIEPQKRLELVAQESLLYAELSIRENLELFSALAGRDSFPTELVDRFSLATFLEKRISDCSAGITRRVSIVRALLSSPDILLLDEPFLSLDKLSKEVLKEIISEELLKQRCVLVATHEPFYLPKTDHSLTIELT